jgi:hypothetical protein
MHCKKQFYIVAPVVCVLNEINVRKGRKTDVCFFVVKKKIWIGMEVRTYGTHNKAHRASEGLIETVNKHGRHYSP